MSNRLIPLYPGSATETPLDLTVRRSDMDPCDEHVYGEPSYDMPSVSVTPPTPDYYNQYQPNGYYVTADQYTPNMYVPGNHPQYSTEMINQHVNAGYSLGSTSAPTNLNGPPSPGYETSHSPTEMTGYNSSILPKKRKNLWRPYDSKGHRGIPMEHEMDSGSDSGSNSSDQELKIQESLEDPVKRRKRNMIKYAEEHMDKRETFVKPKPQTVSSQSMCPTVTMTSVMNNPVKTHEPVTSYMASSSKGGYRDEAREKLISDIKKRDVFGWSLKLSKPSEDFGSSDGNQTVCQDGEKTYIELQTVRTSNSPGKQNQSHTQDTNDNNKEQSPQKLLNAINSQGKRSPGSKNKKKNSDKEKEENFVSKTVYIQRRDNVIESCDETKSNAKTNVETKKGVSLIDLIEEIEADALKKDQEEVEKTKQRNANIVKILEQCNHVKLQALDYLMSNVLIQDKGPTFKNKNEKVQKMLKGDKISSLNMLDVVELQVEMGLN